MNCRIYCINYSNYCINYCVLPALSIIHLPQLHQFNLSCHLASVFCQWRGGGEVREHNGEVVTESCVWSGPCRRGSWKRLLQQSRCRSESGSRAQPVSVNHRGHGLRLMILRSAPPRRHFELRFSRTGSPSSRPHLRRVLSVC